MKLLRVGLQWVLCILLSSGMWQSTYARNADLVTERAWLEDPTGQMTWEQVREQPMKPLENIFSGGFSAAPVWLRLRIDPTAEKVENATHLYLRIRPMYLDEIVLFDPLQNPKKVLPLGDRYPLSAQAEPATTFLFALPAGDTPRDIWLRVQTTSSRLIYADVFTPEELRSTAARINHLGSLYLGLIAVFLLWSVLQTLIRPELLAFATLLNMASWLLLGASFLGYFHLYFADFFPQGVIDLSTSFLVLITTGTTLFFSHGVLNELGAARWRRNAVYCLLSIFPLLIVALYFGHVRLALTINMGLVLFGPVLLWAMAFLSRSSVITDDSTAKHSALTKPVIMGYMTLTLIFTLLTALPALGLIQGVELSIYTVFFYSLSSGILMVMMLQYRAWQNMKLESEWRVIAIDAKARAQQEKEYREEREHLLAMLGHELKTPLATMRMLLADREIPSEICGLFNLSVSEMTHVVNRVMQSGQLEAGQVRLHLEHGHFLNMTKSVCSELTNSDRIVIKVISRSSLDLTTDLQLFKVILRNLLDNALKYSPEHSSVLLTIGSTDKGDYLWLCISNSIGRSGAPDPERVFEKFYRNIKAGHHSGSGLGLYLVRGLTNALDGKITFELGDDQVNFRLSLPTFNSGVSA